MSFFFFNDTATTEIYTLSLHDALPIFFGGWRPFGAFAAALLFGFSSALAPRLVEYSKSADLLFQALPYVLTLIAVAGVIGRRSEEHTSELQSRQYLVCRLLLEKKKNSI